MRKLVLVAALAVCLMSCSQGDTTGGADGKSGTSGTAGGKGEPGPAGPAGPAGASGAPKSGSRLKVRTTIYRGADGYEQPTFSILDSERDNEECYPGGFAASDGALRCLPIPSAISGTNYFTEATCTVAKPVAVVPSTSITTPKYIYVSSTANGTARYAFFTAAQYGGQVFSGSSASCSQVQFPGSTLYTTGTEIAPTSFVEITKTVN